MATITSAQSGNWSDTATWVGGVVPVSGDTAVVNHSVTLDVDIDGITYQGTSNLVINGTSRSITNLTYNGAPRSGSAGGKIQIINTSTSDTVSVTGDITVTGNVTGAFFVNISPVTYDCVLTSLLNTTALTFMFDFRANTILNFNGSATINGTNGTMFFFRTNGGQYDINGVFNSTVGNLVDGSNSLGVIRGSSENSSSAIKMFNDSSRLEVSGVHSTTTDLFPFSTNEFVKIASEDLQVGILDTANASTPLYNAGLLTGYPLEEDVEDGVIYGPSDEFEGTLSPVNVDTAQLASDLLDDIQTSSHVVAQRLRAAATDDSVGSIVASTLGAP